MNYIMTVGADGGNKNIKLYGENGELMFASELGEYRERKLESTFTDDDIIFEFDGRKGFAGTLAQHESEFSASIMGDTKAHDEFLIRVLIGLHKYTDETNEFNLVVGQPINKHVKSEKQKMKNLLEGEHTITVNDITKTITIHRVEIGAEGGSAFWSNSKPGLVRIVDFGSGTVNCASLRDGRYIDKDSFSMKQGLETMLTDDFSSFARAVSVKALKKWDVDDTVLLCGGGAEKMLEYMKEHFTNVQLLQPKVKVKNGSSIQLKPLPPVYANAVGFYNIGKNIFKREEADAE